MRACMLKPRRRRPSLWPLILVFWVLSGVTMPLPIEAMPGPGDAADPLPEIRLDLQRLQEAVDRLQRTMDTMVQRGLVVGPAKPESERKPLIDPSQLFGRAIEKGQRLGPADAPIQILAFADFECPYCARSAGIGPHLVRESKGEVAYVFRNNPLKRHKRAIEAARAAWAAGQQGKFWEMHDAIFKVGRKLKDVDFIEMASGLGLDRERFATDLSFPKSLRVVEQDIFTARLMQARQTPTFFVNGKKIVGADIAILVNAVDAAREQIQQDQVASEPVPEAEDAPAAASSRAP